MGDHHHPDPAVLRGDLADDVPARLVRQEARYEREGLQVQREQNRHEYRDGRDVEGKPPGQHAADDGGADVHEVEVGVGVDGAELLHPRLEAPALEALADVGGGLGLAGSARPARAYLHRKLEKVLPYPHVTSLRH